MICYIKNNWYIIPIGLHKSLIHLQFKNKQAVNKTNLQEDFPANHISSIFIETLTWWIHHKFQQTPEEIIRYFYTLLDGVVEFLYIK